MKNLICKLWKTLKRPPVHLSLGAVILVSFVAGIVFWGGFNTALEATNTEEFCISCHEMQNNPYQELQGTVHWSNRSGVRATCPDCHVPHDWTDKIARKMQASKEVWGKIFGTIDTREKFLEKRLELAQHEWARFSANGSLECRNCHDYNSMNWEVMSDQAKRFMKPAAERNQSCIDCHKGIAHHLPEQMTFKDPALDQLEQRAQGLSPNEGESYYTVRAITLYLDEARTQAAGELEAASPVQVLEESGDSVKLLVPAWRKTRGFGRVLYEDFGMNITSLVLEKDMAQDEALVKVLDDAKVDSMTGLPWEPVEVALWAEQGALLPEAEDIWSYARDTYRTACSVCHSQPAEAHFDANTWPGMFAGMVGFTNMDAATQALVLKYLQKHSSDFADGAH
ncbi:pentaheme c-type cytochrome TorC [Oceanimonas pelagia]|uniref:Cytochrome c-type protein n=1 Tax=Oceanimonas pelagia TaxID=3028314 RepID=A0AA50KRA1_9GAMM|nr:pentaheme c-type cytochrome TorC [Oceanimonas pelagia]WMC11871.1 pentaheme c-type cytochrome TorC [Oceanimonas pelagia]